MSANYNQHTINKKILNKFEKPRAESDVLGPYGKYRDEYLKTYNRKREAFKKIARKYCQHNCQMLISCKDKKYDFEPDFAQILTEEKDDIYKDSGPLLLRKRVECHLDVNQDFICEIFTLEPWMRRFLILSRFVLVARKVVLKNRLLKNLDILRKLTQDDVNDLESTAVKYHNVTYSELFRRFV